MDFCSHLSAPTDPEMYESVGERYALFTMSIPTATQQHPATRIDPMLMSPGGPIMTEADIAKFVGREDIEARAVLAEVNARKAVPHMYQPKHNFAHEMHYGMNAVVERGVLGLAVV